MRIPIFAALVAVVLLVGVPEHVGAVPSIDVSPGASPAGYLPLSLFGIVPTAAFTDDSIVNTTVPGFVYAGETWTTIGAGSNGYLVIGGGDSLDVTTLNQNLPNAVRPNNVLAPFWTDLDPSAGGAIREGVLTDGVNSWIVIDWEAVPNFGATTTNSFQVWIGVNGAEDISFVYGPVAGGTGGFLTVGAEDKTGTVGDTYYFNGVGTAPTNGTQLRVTTTDLPLPVAAVPESLTLLLVGSGFAGLAAWRRRPR